MHTYFGTNPFKRFLLAYQTSKQSIEKTFKKSCRQTVEITLLALHFFLGHLEKTELDNMAVQKIVKEHNVKGEEIFTLGISHIPLHGRKSDE